ncbi:MAG: fatty acid kinase fatty acid binding subunit [Gaiellaceae bacterium]|nr:fatty acid kinase fatty acid binding subunit [Gaiellaceae bacterium]
MNLTAANTAIVLDSTADIPDAALRFPNWRGVPLYVRFGEESFKDGVEITADAFYERLRVDPEFPRTSQPTPADFLRCYRELISYERIYSLHLSGKVSGTILSAESAAEELGHGVVHAVDTETASASIAMLALAIQRRLERGTTDEEIDELIYRYKRERGLLFTVDTLEFLQRGGRIGKARAFAGSVLNVKPILSVVDGEVAPVKRVRGERKAFAELVAAIETETTDEPGWRLALGHAAAPERAAELEALIRERRPHAELELVVTLGAVIGAHAGPGTLGLFWFRDAADGASFSP